MAEQTFEEIAGKVVEILGPRTMVPTKPEAEAMHVGSGDLPFMPLPDGSGLQLLHVDLNVGLWVSNVRLPAGAKLAPHYHTGLVYAVTHKGKWFYEEYPDVVNGPESYLFEPAGSLHTLCTPADQDGETLVWFAIYGANLNVDENGNVVAVVDAQAALDLYRAYAQATDTDISKLIVIGEQE